MTGLLAALSLRYSDPERERVVSMQFSLDELQWLCGFRAEITEAAHASLRGRGYIDESGHLTAAGKWLREATTRPDAVRASVRRQNGGEADSLELFLHDDLVLVVDTRGNLDPTPGYFVGYASPADISNVVARWLPIHPSVLNTDEDFTMPLVELVESAKSPDSGISLFAVRVNNEPAFDFISVEDQGYFFLTSGEPDSSGAPVAALEWLTSLNVFLLFTDVASAMQRSSAAASRGR